MDRAAPTMTRLEQAAILLLWLYLFAVLAAHAGLVGQGYWGDEYLDFTFLRSRGLAFWSDRVLGWSPRPLAEALFVLYGAAVQAFQRPLVAPALGLLLAGAGLPLLLATPRAARLQVASLLVLWLSCGHLGEVLYWPASALAYVPTMAAILLLWIVLTQPVVHPVAAPLASTALLLVAAASSEIGASFVVFLVAAIAALRLQTWRWLAAPALLAALVLLRVATVRLTVPEMPGYGDPTLRGTLLPAAAASVAQLAREFAAVDGASTPALLVAGKLLWLAGCALLAPAARGPQARAAAAVAAAALAASLLSLFIAYRHFGGPCCDRHIAVRHFLVLLGLLAAAPLLARPVIRLLPVRPARRAGLVLLAAGVLLASAPRLSLLRQQYALHDAVSAERKGIWRSGLDGTPTMIAGTPVDGPLIHPQPLAPGRYVYQPAVPSLPNFMMAFFGKQSLEVRQPSP